MTLVTTRGILLRSHPYSESSRILRFFTPDHGILAVIARGARKRTSKGEGPIETFGEGTLTVSYRPDRDLHTLTDFERVAGSSGEGGSLALARDMHRFLGASLLAELLLSHTLEEGDAELYEWVLSTLGRLADEREATVPGWILAGAWRTLAHLGFPPGIERCIRCGTGITEGEMCRFDVQGGGLLCAWCAPDSGMRRVGPRARTQLRALVAGSPPDPLPGLGAHFGLLEAFTHHHLAPSRPFRAFGMLRPLLPEESADGETGSGSGGEGALFQGDGG